MPLPVSPNDFKNLLNDLGGSVCDKFFNLMKRFPELVYQVILYERNEDGTLSDEMKDDICSLGCAGGDGSTGGSTLAAPTGVSATDGTLGDRVRVTWNFVTGATSYQVFRRETNDSTGATHIGSPTTTEYDDTTAEADKTYYYWIKAVTATASSAYSSPDTGYIATDLGAISDLDASQGFYPGTASTGYIALVWTPISGASAYDIYRSETDSFSTATLVDSDRVPFDNTASLSLGPSPTFVDNGGEVVYYHQPPIYNRKYYFWVKAKRTTPTPATSAESNSADGWVIGWGDGSSYITTSTLTVPDQTVTVPAGATKAWIVLYGNGGAGAGGGGTYGGGGGGGGAMAWGELAVASGGVLKLVLSPTTPATNAASEANGSAGSVTQLQYQAPAGSFVTKLQSTAAPGGTYSATGAGAGGAGSVASASGMTSSVLKDGRPGKAGNGSAGGRGGHRFAGTRTPGAHFNGFTSLGHTGNSGSGGGGSYASPGNPALAEGGSNGASLAQAVFVFRT